jgi:glycosyltransferase involved in cell wall biosynthesis
MSKYLREFGIEPVIYTPQDPDYPAIDRSLEEEVPQNIEVVQSPIWEPYHLYRKLTGKKKNAKIYSGFLNDSKSESLGQKISVFIRSNFFIPDARKFWINPSVKFLTKYLKTSPVDVIISTGPPHSMHLIALGVKQTTGIPWIADFRDPWTNIDFYQHLNLASWADKKHRSLEQDVLKTADKIVTVSPSWVDDFEALCNREVELITNGFDPQDFKDQEELDAEISFTHIGSINNDRNPQVLWESLEVFLQQNPQVSDTFKLRLIGPVDQSVIASIEGQPLLSTKLDHIPWQDHATAVKSMLKSRVLLLLVNKSPNASGILPGKLYEYMGTGRPIISIGPPVGDVVKIIENSGTGICVPLDDKEKMLEAFSRFFHTNVKSEHKDMSAIHEFSRRELAGKYSELIKKVIVPKSVERAIA